MADKSLPLDFNWVIYTNNYKDLNYFTKEKAEKHYVTYGKREGRLYSSIKEEDESENIKVPPGFDWKSYIDRYPDLKNSGINTKEESELHYIHHGKREGREFRKINDYTRSKRNYNNKKCAKIICTYHGPRRGLFNNPTNMKDYLLRVIQNEVEIDHGISTDTIIVNNRAGNIEMDNLIEGFNGIKTKCGKIIIEHRENIGGSFGAYFDMFAKHSKMYDYFLFIEDDHIIKKQKYALCLIDYLESDEDIGFVSIPPITEKYIREGYASGGGGIGLTSTKKFIEVYGKDSISGPLSYRQNMNLNDQYDALQTYELKFSSNFVNVKTKDARQYFRFLRNHPEFSSLPSNWERFPDNYSLYLDESNLQKEHIYLVGNE